MCAKERSTSSARWRIACWPTSERNAVVVNRPARVRVAVPARDAPALRFGNPAFPRPPVQVLQDGARVIALVGHALGRVVRRGRRAHARQVTLDRKSTRLNSSHPSISYAVFCLKKKKNTNKSSLSVYSI